MHRHYTDEFELSVIMDIFFQYFFPVEKNHWTKTTTSTEPLFALAVHEKTDIHLSRGIWTEVLRLGRLLDWSQLWSPQLRTVNQSILDLKREGKPWPVDTMDEHFYTWTKMGDVDWCAIPLWKKIDRFIWCLQKPADYLKVLISDPMWAQFHAAFSNVLIHTTNHH